MVNVQWDGTGIYFTSFNFDFYCRLYSFQKKKFTGFYCSCFLKIKKKKKKKKKKSEAYAKPHSQYLRFDHHK